MKKNSFWIFSLIVVLCLALALMAGCAAEQPAPQQPAPEAEAPAESEAPPEVEFNYPDENVEIIVPVPAGGSSDTVARLLADGLSKATGETFFATNMAGGALTIGTDAMTKSDPDGYTLLATPLGPIVMQPHYKELPYTIDQIKPIAYTCARYDILAVKPGTYATLQELIDAIVAAPGAIKYGNVAAGGLPHIATENFMLQINGDSTGVAFNGDADTLTALLGGHIDYAIVGGSVNEYCKTGDLVALAVGSPERLENLPDVPTFAELGYDVDTSIWEGVFAPGDLPDDIADYLNEQINAILTSPEFIESAAVVGEVPNPMSREEFITFVQEQYDMYDHIINDTPAGEKIKAAMNQ